MNYRTLAVHLATALLLASFALVMAATRLAAQTAGGQQTMAASGYQIVDQPAWEAITNRGRSLPATHRVRVP
jgi:hypothetical protein